MQYIVTLILLLLCAHGAQADNRRQLFRLDSVMHGMDRIKSQKEMKIASLKQTLARADSERERMALCYSIFNEYYVTHYDSALFYIDKVYRIALRSGDRAYMKRAVVDKAELMAIGGLYTESVQMLDRTPPDSTARQETFNYYIAYFHIFMRWADYCGDSRYAPRYRSTSRQYLKRAMALLDAGSPLYDYYRGEYCVYALQDNRKALTYYFNVLKSLPHDRREYAMAAWAIANNYSAVGNMQLYEYYLCEAAIADLQNCSRESMALQDLAMYLYIHDSDNMERAEKYITYAMNEARLYNNRLRMLEMSKTLPVIVDAYKQTLTQKNSRLRTGTFCISLLTVVMVVLLYFFMKQNRLLTAKRRELSEANTSLYALNTRLHVLNGRLMDTNRRREHLAKLYIDLCANFIDRLQKLEMLVRRKIKANQIKDLLSMASSSRLSEEDATVFLRHFDKAFLDLYPTFVDEFNALLQDDARIKLPKGNAQLTTELRIFALVRLGVTESSEIAALLFYTPRTIYNYRSTVKAKARNRDTFEQDVAQLCNVM